jgi:hypothetical protein
MKSKPMKKLGRPPGTLTAVQFEKEIAALERLWKAGHILEEETYHRKLEELEKRFEEGR